jgi:hypothetical protein
MAELVATARRDVTLLATALMYHNTDVLRVALDSCAADTRLALAEAAALLRDSYRAVLSLALGRPVDDGAAETAFGHPSVDLGAWVRDRHGVCLPSHVQAWIGAVLVGEPWPPERDLVLHLATALWLIAGLWEHCALPGEWGNFVAGRTS